MDLTPMDWIRDAIANAQADGLNIDDLAAMSEHAETAQAFNEAVNELIRATVG